jgi:hypothetical protein
MPQATPVHQQHIQCRYVVLQTDGLEWYQTYGLALGQAAQTVTAWSRFQGTGVGTIAHPVPCIHCQQPVPASAREHTCKSERGNSA